MKIILSLLTFSILTCHAAQREDLINTDRTLEFERLASRIQRLEPESDGYKRITVEAHRTASLILPTDKTPVDVVIRRTIALAKHLGTLNKTPDLKKESAALKKLIKANQPNLTIDQQQKLFREVCAIRRKIAFKNPLLDFDQIMFLKHDRQINGNVHMVDQYLGVNQAPGGGVFILKDPFGSSPTTEDILSTSTVESGRLKGNKLNFDTGSVIALDLDYDAKSILFAFTEMNKKTPTDLTEWENQPWQPSDIKSKLDKDYFWHPKSSFNVFRANADGSNLHQFTDSMWNDIDPFFLPNGRIGFISGRSGGTQRCGYRYIPGYTLFGMMGDGSDIIQLSWHDTNEWQPSVDNNGMIIYSRWDYVDRDSDIAHHLWFCYPDGRDPRSVHGNYPIKRETRPWMEQHIRAIPGSREYIAVSGAHHGEAYGSLMLINQSIEDDRATGQIKRITPHELFSESESAPGVPHKKGANNPLSDTFSTPWPLSEDFYLCVYFPDPDWVINPLKDKSKTPHKLKRPTNYGIYLVDSYGNYELLYKDPSISCLDPIPLRSRVRPPALPIQTAQAKADQPNNQKPKTGTVSVMNVYESEFPFPEGTKIKELRIVNIYPKSTHGIGNPAIGTYQSIARGVLGTVPVEEDGSVYFECPAEVPVYFQAIDDQGLAVHTMRSDTYVHPGEHLSCIGCHEDTHKAPALKANPIALQRAPSKIKPEPTGSYPLSFPRLVQPVIDAKCLSCHNKEEKAPSLRGDVFEAKSGWSDAMKTLRRYAWGKTGGNGAIHKSNERSYSIPGQDGARVTKLWKLLEEGHYDVKLTTEEKRRITLWMDCNSNFYGAYKDIEKQQKGEVVPAKYGFLPEWIK